MLHARFLYLTLTIFSSLVSDTQQSVKRDVNLDRLFRELDLDTNRSTILENYDAAQTANELHETINDRFDSILERLKVEKPKWEDSEIRTFHDYGGPYIYYQFDKSGNVGDNLNEANPETAVEIESDETLFSQPINWRVVRVVIYIIITIVICLAYYTRLHHKRKKALANRRNRQLLEQVLIIVPARREENDSNCAAPEQEACLGDNVEDPPPPPYEEAVADLRPPTYEETVEEKARQ